MKNDIHRWDLQAYQDALRPHSGQTVEFAILASYSLDLPSLAAVVLALARQDNDRGHSNSAAFVTAINTLRGRVSVLVQKGQFPKPNHVPKLSSLLDQFVHEVSTERTRMSWHAKAFLIKLTSEGQTQWRFWLGSKNITKDEAWDVGLLLASDTSGKGQQVPGIVDAAFRMAQRAELKAVAPTLLRTELDEVTWQIPAGIQVEEISWLDRQSRPYPALPPNAAKVFVVSPFLDPKTLNHFGTKGQRRLLLSLDCELARLETERPGALAGFSGGIHAMMKPAEAAEHIAAESDELSSPDGLHAKLFYAEAGKRRVLWAGSANATSRGLNGPNQEILARLQLSAEMAAGLEHFILSQRLLDEAKIPRLPEEPNAKVKRRLQVFRDEFLHKHELTQRRSSAGPRILCVPPPDIPDDIALRVGPLFGELVEWPSGAAALLLPISELYEECELVQVQIELDCCKLQWLQAAKLTPPPGERRDAAVIRKHLSCQELLAILRVTLGGLPSDDGPPWDDDGATHSPQRSRVGVWSTFIPTLEEILKSDRSRLLTFDRYYREYLEHENVSQVGLSKREQQLLDNLHAMWRTVRSVLIPEDVL